MEGGFDYTCFLLRAEINASQVEWTITSAIALQTACSGCFRSATSLYFALSASMLSSQSSCNSLIYYSAIVLPRAKVFLMWNWDCIYVPRMPPHTFFFEFFALFLLFTDLAKQCSHSLLEMRVREILVGNWINYMRRNLFSISVIFSSISPISSLRKRWFTDQSFMSVVHQPAHYSSAKITRESSPPPLPLMSPLYHDRLTNPTTYDEDLPRVSSRRPSLEAPLHAQSVAR